MREIFNLAITEEDSFDELLGKFNMWKVVRVGAWVTRFVTNLRVREGERTTGPLKTKETQKQIYGRPLPPKIQRMWNESS